MTLTNPLFLLLAMASFMAIVLHSFGQNDLACGPNAEMRHCGKHCEQKCGHLHPKPWKCMCRPLSCGCNPGYARNNQTGQCVLVDNCPRSSSSGDSSSSVVEKACGPNEYMDSCGNRCSEPNCDDPPGKMCTKNCDGAACQCVKGYARNSKGQCILEADCQRSNGGNSLNVCAGVTCPADSLCVPLKPLNPIIVCFWNGPPCGPLAKCVPIPKSFDVGDV